MNFIRRQQILNKQYSLTDDELNQLIYKAQSGCIEAMNTVIEKNIGLIVGFVGKQHHPRYQEDCFQEGYFGMRRAIQKFDPTKGFKFSTYVTFWLRAATGRWLKNNEHTIRVPEAIKERNQYAYISINQTIDDETPLEIASYDPEPQEEDLILTDLMGCLDNREKRIIRSHLDGQTFKKISKKENISKSRAQQIHQEAINKMKLEVNTCH